jgi:DNA-binding HxlR family transcriptional regulator
MAHLHEEDPAERPAIRLLAEEMAHNGSGRDAPARSVMGMLGDRWTTLILIVLNLGEMRHADLKRVIARLSSEQAISQRVLTLKLRALERDGFVLRTATEDVPPKVSYSLSPMGEALATRAKELIGWINTHNADIKRARANHDSSG